MQLERDCRICGEPVRVSRQRYLELVRTDAYPVCRKNGCFRYVGRASGAVLSGAEGVFLREKIGVGRSDDRPLAKLRSGRVLATGWANAVEVADENET